MNDPAFALRRGPSDKEMERMRSVIAEYVGQAFIR